MARASRENTHRKLPEQVAFMQFAFEAMQSWSVDRGVPGETEAKDLSEEAWGIFNTLSAKQSERIADDEPIKRFTDIVTALISQKTVRIEHRGNAAGTIKGGENGDLIGYYDDNYWYMLPVPLWQNVNRYCAQEQAHFPLTRDTLYRRLANKGLIQVENGRHTINIRIRGEQKRVLKFIARGICQNEVTEVTHGS